MVGRYTRLLEPVVSSGSLSVSANLLSEQSTLFARGRGLSEGLHISTMFIHSINPQSLVESHIYLSIDHWSNLRPSCRMSGVLPSGCLVAYISPIMVHI
jgi:hypothetical protein